MTVMMPRTYLLSAGSNARGQLAIDSLDDVHNFTHTLFQDSPRNFLPTNTIRVVDIACGSNFTLILLEVMHSPRPRIELWASGDGSRGQLGPSYSRDQPKRQFALVDLHLLDHGLGGYTLHAVAAGWETSYAILTSAGQDDVLVSLGSNDFGDLGTGSTKTDSSDFHLIHRVSLRNSMISEAGSRLSIASVVAGTHHAIACCTLVSSDGSLTNTVVGWGASRHGQLGSSAPPTSLKPFPVLLQPQGPDKFIMAATGSQHTVLLRDDRTLLGIGSNRKSQLAGLDTLSSVSSIHCTWNGTYAVLDQTGTWSIVATGDGSKGQLGCAPPTNPPSDVVRTVRFPFSSDTHSLLKLACGSEHVLCLFSRCDTANDTNTLFTSNFTEVWGWGWNEHGNLGLDHTGDIFLPTKVWPIPGDGDLGRIIDIWAGCGTSWMLVDNARS